MPSDPLAVEKIVYWLTDANGSTMKAEQIGWTWPSTYDDLPSFAQFLAFDGSLPPIREGIQPAFTLTSGQEEVRSDG